MRQWASKNRMAPKIYNVYFIRFFLENLGMLANLGNICNEVLHLTEKASETHWTTGVERKLFKI